MWVSVFGAGGGIRAEAAAGTGMREEHKGDQRGWGSVGDGASRE